MIINGLDSQAIETAELKTDHRWAKWAKWVDGVDPKGTDGFAFKGDFIRSGTIEVDEKSLPRAILCCAETGSSKHRSKAYRAVVLQKDGSLVATELQTDDARGWAIRLREPMIQLLDQVKAERTEATYTPPPVLVELSQTTMDRLNTFKQTVGETSDDLAILTAIDVYLSMLERTKTEGTHVDN